MGEINEVNGARPILRMCLVTKTTPWPTESRSADADSVEVRCGFKSRLVEQKASCLIRAGRKNTKKGQWLN